MTTGMKQLMADVAEFHRISGKPINLVPRVGERRRLNLMRALIREEARETQAALEDLREKPWSQDAMCDVADGLVDLIYVCLSAAIELGIPLWDVWDAVQASNMAKQGGPVREDGKLLKPPGWQPPDIHKAIWGIDDPPSVGGE